MRHGIWVVFVLVLSGGIFAKGRIRGKHAPAVVAVPRAIHEIGGSAIRTRLSMEQLQAVWGKLGRCEDKRLRSLQAVFSDDGASLVVTYPSGHLAEFEAKTGKLVKFSAPAQPSDPGPWEQPAVGLSPSGKWFAIGGRVKSQEETEFGSDVGRLAAENLQVFDRSKSIEKPAFQLSVKGMGAVTQIHFSPDEKIIVSQHRHQKPALVFWNTEGKLLHMKEDFDSASREVEPAILAFSEPSDRVLVRGQIGVPREKHDVVQAIHTQTGNWKPADHVSLQASPSGKPGTYAVRGQNGQLQFFDIDQQAPFFSQQIARGTVDKAVLSSDGLMFLSQAEKTGTLWDVASRTPLISFPMHGEDAPLWSRDGAYFAIPTRDCQFEIRAMDGLLPKVEKEWDLKKTREVLTSKDRPTLALSLGRYLEKNPEYAARVFENVESDQAEISDAELKALIEGMDARRRRQREQSEAQLRSLIAKGPRKKILRALQAEIAAHHATREAGGVGRLEVAMRANRLRKGAQTYLSADPVIQRLLPIAKRQTTEAARDFLSWAQ